ncbi:MAG: peptidoglycan DD-metalloendopeptidase family protein [Patescibacteria group bacterium]|nr:peptidoglycan DD-metalloendopeptidase family protein [Patescibacteria group bacterium]
MQKIKAIILPIIIYILISPPFNVSAQEVRDIVFPIEEGWDYNFTDTYGALRSGERTHLGIDLMVDQMTPLLAAVDGRVSYLVEKDQGWGLAIYIEDAQGYSYRYLHINNDTPGTNDNKEIRAYAFPRDIVRGSVVSAGQIIAFAGNSGNAEGVAHHLHFEIWTPSRQSINPYPSLMAAIGQPITQPNGEIGNINTYQFTRDLKLGSTGEDVRELQKYLNQSGFIVSSSGAGSSGNETTYFGPATEAALIKFQQAKGISPAAGYFGSITRTFVNSRPIETIEEIVSPITNDIVRAGWLVKDKLSPRVYYVAPNLELQWIVSEEAAVRNFGSNWYLEIREFDDLENLGLFFGDYVL